ncbi:MAG: DsbA family protein [Minisyncoccota bacterium]
MDQPSSTPSKQSFAIPGAIVAAGILVAGAIFITSSKEPAVADGGKNTATVAGSTNSPSKLNPINAGDYLRGNPNAPVKIVEYSDTECPFCKQFHVTMQRIMSEYGTNGQVAWVYRFFPLSIHPKAPMEAMAVACAGDTGGAAKFWEYLDKIFEVTPSNNNLDPRLLDTIAAQLGIDQTKFDTCRTTNKFAQKIQADYDSGIIAGVQGTPYSVIIGRDGKQYPVDGAQPYEVVKQMVDQALK